MEKQFLYNKKNNISLFFLDGYMGAVNECGDVVIDVLRRYDELVVLDTPGLIKYREGSRWGLLDNRGNVICTTKYAEIDEFYNGFSLALKNIDGKFYYGFIDMRGMEVTKFDYIGGYPFKFGYGLLIKNGTLYYVTKNGSVTTRKN